MDQDIALHLLQRLSRVKQRKTLYFYLKVKNPDQIKILSECAYNILHNPEFLDERVKLKRYLKVLEFLAKKQNSLKNKVATLLKLPLSFYKIFLARPIDLLIEENGEHHQPNGLGAGELAKEVSEKNQHGA